MDADELLQQIKLPDNVDYDAYANEEDIAKIKDVSEYRDETWKEITLPPNEKGSLLCWPSTHQVVQIREGELSLWAGKEGRGKSLVTGQVMASLIGYNQRVLIASMEMPIRVTLARLVKQVTGVSEPTEKYFDMFFETMRGKLFLYDHTGSVSAKRMLGVSRYAMLKLDVDQVLIDSLMMIDIPNSRSSFEYYAQQKNFTHSLANMSRDLNKHIHLVTHMRKSPAGFGEKGGSDEIEGSGALKNLASNVYIIRGSASKRKEESKPETDRDEDIMSRPDVMVSIEKSRNGQRGEFNLWLDRGTLQLRDTNTTSPMKFFRAMLEAS